MSDVGLDRRDERLSLIAIKVFGIDRPFLPKPSGEQSMHAVDHPHARPMDQNGWQLFLYFREKLHVLRVLALESRREAWL
ncbi:hypothetical protein GCM10022419_121050 [Nonomuraea rosea]|uniref:Uncharacterized protein n=1 Tax=Nonomuraea rosea TaxID=638574 RepID=A0ABP6ZPX3_9ACTN